VDYDWLEEENMARGFKTQAPKEVTLVIAFILWIIGVAATVLGALVLPDNYGVWALVLAGLLLILGSVVDGL
jgi:VIT1/CCC1 family predicted Fe2+/Mn2+ transporter